MDVLLRDIELAKKDSSKAGIRRLTALETHKKSLEAIETKPCYGRWNKVEGKPSQDIVEILSNETFDRLSKKQNAITNSSPEIDNSKQLR